MGLSFTKISDRSGAALYVLHDGSHREQENWSRFAEQVIAETGAQAAVLSIKDQDGEKVRDFYDLDPMSLPHVLIVRDTDEIAQSWSGSVRPKVTDVTYGLRQVGV